MIAIFIILALMSVPLTLIFTRTFVRLRQIKAEEGRSAHVLLLEAQVRELTQRMEVLETIVTDDRVLVEPMPELQRLHSRALAPQA